MCSIRILRTRSAALTGITLGMLGLDVPNSFAAADERPKTRGVALYGEIDTGIAYLHQPAGTATPYLTQGLIDGSYVGVRGSESLGNGLTALFTLEHGFSSTDGDAINDHPKYVGIAGETFGTLTFGHQYDALNDYFAPFTLTGNSGGTAFAHPFDNDNANSSYLASNAIKYASPDIDGFAFGANVAFSTAAGGVARNRAYSVGARFTAGAFQIGGAYLQVDGLGHGTRGAYAPQPLPLTPTSDASSGIVPKYDLAIARRQRTIGIGGSYAIGDATVALAYSRAVYTGVADADDGMPAPSIGFTNLAWSGSYLAGDLVQFTAMVSYTRAAAGHWLQGGTQAIYTLSPRTNVYVEWVGQRASAGQRAMLNGFAPSSGRHQWLLATGMRHTF